MGQCALVDAPCESSSSTSLHSRASAAIAQLRRRATDSATLLRELYDAQSLIARVRRRHVLGGTKISQDAAPADSPADSRAGPSVTPTFTSP